MRIRTASTRPPFFTAEVIECQFPELSTCRLQRGRRSSRRRSRCAKGSRTPRYGGFNEAAVLHGGGRPALAASCLEVHASTRPPFFTAEVSRAVARGRSRVPSFNEAAVLHGGGRRARASAKAARTRLQRGRRSSRRRSHRQGEVLSGWAVASTRPPFFTAEVLADRRKALMATPASTRPPFFTAEVAPWSAPMTANMTLQRGRRSSRRRSGHTTGLRKARALASTRPPFFTAEVAFVPHLVRP